MTTLPRINKLGVSFILSINILMLASACYAQHSPAAGFPETQKAFLNEKNSAVIPFTRYKDWIILRVKVNDREERSFLFDTGAPINILKNEQDIELLKLQTSGSIMVAGAGSAPPSPVPLAVNAKFKLGDLEIKNAVIAVGPAKEVLSGLDGIIGKCVFENSIVEINWKKSVLIVSDRNRYEFPEKGTALPLTILPTGHFATDIKVENSGKTITTKAVIDLGNRSSFFLDRSVASSIIDDQKLIKDVITGWGASGSVRGDVGRTTVIISGLTVADIPTAYRSNTKFLAAGAPANIGLSVLDKFDIILDYAGQRMIVVPNETFAYPVPYNQTGIIVGPKAEGNYLLVADIIPGSPAFEAGVKMGDKIVSVNDVDAKSVPDVEKLIAGKEVIEIRIGIERDGRTINLKLRPRKLV